MATRRQWINKLFIYTKQHNETSIVKTKGRNSSTKKNVNAQCGSNTHNFCHKERTFLWSCRDVMVTSSHLVLSSLSGDNTATKHDTVHHHHHHHHHHNISFLSRGLHQQTSQQFQFPSVLLEVESQVWDEMPTLTPTTVIPNEIKHLHNKGPHSPAHSAAQIGSSRRSCRDVKVIS